MEDIIASIPWNCGNSDCPVGWHKSNYWAYEDGEFSEDKYGDGDHEECTEQDVPGIAVIEAAWVDYHEYVANTGLDPLCEYIIKRNYTRSAEWVLVYEQLGELGAVLRGASKGRRWWNGELLIDLPQHVQEFADVAWRSTTVHIYGDGAEHNVLLWNGVWDDWMDSKPDRSLGTLAKLAEEAPDTQVVLIKDARHPVLYTYAKIEEVVPRKDSAVERDLKKAARKALARGKKRLRALEGNTTT